MLKYFQEVLHAMWKETTKSKLRSRKTKGNRFDITKGKTSIDPEVLAPSAVNEKLDVENTKDIVSLKKTYEMLMMKFVNPRLDLVSSGIRSLEYLKSLNLKRKDFGNIPTRGNKENLKNNPALPSNNSGDELNSEVCEKTTLGWDGQPTVKLISAAKVETSLYPEDIDSALFVFPEIEDHSLPKKDKLSNKKQTKNNKIADKKSLKSGVKKKPDQLIKKIPKSHINKFYDFKDQNSQQESQEHCMELLKKSPNSSQSPAIGCYPKKNSTNNSCEIFEKSESPNIEVIIKEEDNVYNDHLVSPNKNKLAEGSIQFSKIEPCEQIEMVDVTQNNNSVVKNPDKIVALKKKSMDLEKLDNTSVNETQIEINSNNLADIVEKLPDLEKIENKLINNQSEINEKENLNTKNKTLHFSEKINFPFREQNSLSQANIKKDLIPFKNYSKSIKELPKANNKTNLINFKGKSKSYLNNKKSTDSIKPKSNMPFINSYDGSNYLQRWNKNVYNNKMPPISIREKDVKNSRSQPKISVSKEDKNISKRQNNYLELNINKSGSFDPYLKNYNLTRVSNKIEEKKVIIPKRSKDKTGNDQKKSKIKGCKNTVIFQLPKKSTSSNGLKFLNSKTNNNGNKKYILRLKKCKRGLLKLNSEKIAAGKTSMVPKVNDTVSIAQTKKLDKNIIERKINNHNKIQYNRSQLKLSGRIETEEDKNKLNYAQYYVEPSNKISFTNLKIYKPKKLTSKVKGHITSKLGKPILLSKKLENLSKTLESKKEASKYHIKPQLKDLKIKSFSEARISNLKKDIVHASHTSIPKMSDCFPKKDCKLHSKKLKLKPMTLRMYGTEKYCENEIIHDIQSLKLVPIVQKNNKMKSVFVNNSASKKHSAEFVLRNIQTRNFCTAEYKANIMVNYLFKRFASTVMEKNKTKPVIENQIIPLSQIETMPNIPIKNKSENIEGTLILSKKTTKYALPKNIINRNKNFLNLDGFVKMKANSELQIKHPFAAIQVNPSSKKKDLKIEVLYSRKDFDKKQCSIKREKLIQNKEDKYAIKQADESSSDDFTTANNKITSFSTTQPLTQRIENIYNSTHLCNEPLSNTVAKTNKNEPLNLNTDNTVLIEPNSTRSLKDKSGNVNLSSKVSLIQEQFTDAKKSMQNQMNTLSVNDKQYDTYLNKVNGISKNIDVKLETSSLTEPNNIRNKAGETLNKSTSLSKGQLDLLENTLGDKKCSNKWKSKHERLQYKRLDKGLTSINIMPKESARKKTFISLLFSDKKEKYIDPKSSTSVAKKESTNSLTENVSNNVNEPELDPETGTINRLQRAKNCLQLNSKAIVKQQTARTSSLNMQIGKQESNEVINSEFQTHKLLEREPTMVLSSSYKTQNVFIDKDHGDKNLPLSNMQINRNKPTKNKNIHKKEQEKLNEDAQQNSEINNHVFNLPKRIPKDTFKSFEPHNDFTNQHPNEKQTNEKQSRESKSKVDKNPSKGQTSSFKIQVRKQNNNEATVQTKKILEMDPTMIFSSSYKTKNEFIDKVQSDKNLPLLTRQMIINKPSKNVSNYLKTQEKNTRTNRDAIQKSEIKNFVLNLPKETLKSHTEFTKQHRNKKQIRELKSKIYIQSSKGKTSSFNMQVQKQNNNAVINSQLQTNNFHESAPKTRFKSSSKTKNDFINRCQSDKNIPLLTRDISINKSSNNMSFIENSIHNSKIESDILSLPKRMPKERLKSSELRTEFNTGHQIKKQLRESKSTIDIKSLKRQTSSFNMQVGKQNKTPKFLEREQKMVLSSSYETQNDFINKHKSEKNLPLLTRQISINKPAKNVSNYLKGQEKKSNSDTIKNLLIENHIPNLPKRMPKETFKSFESHTDFIKQHQNKISDKSIRESKNKIDISSSNEENQKEKQNKTKMITQPESAIHTKKNKKESAMLYLNNNNPLKNDKLKKVSASTINLTKILNAKLNHDVKITTAGNQSESSKLNKHTSNEEITRNLNSTNLRDTTLLPATKFVPLSITGIDTPLKRSVIKTSGRSKFDFNKSKLSHSENLFNQIKELQKPFKDSVKNIVPKICSKTSITKTTEKMSKSNMDILSKYQNNAKTTKHTSKSTIQNISDCKNDEKVSIFKKDVVNMPRSTKIEINKKETTPSNLIFSIEPRNVNVNKNTKGNTVSSDYNDYSISSRNTLHEGLLRSTRLTKSSSSQENSGLRNNNKQVKEAEESKKKTPELLTLKTKNKLKVYEQIKNIKIHKPPTAEMTDIENQPQEKISSTDNNLKPVSKNSLNDKKETLETTFSQITTTNEKLSDNYKGKIHPIEKEQFDLMLLPLFDQTTVNSTNKPDENIEIPSSLSIEKDNNKKKVDKHYREQIKTSNEIKFNKNWVLKKKVIVKSQNAGVMDFS